MIENCTYCGVRADCVLLEMVSWLCPDCFIKFYEYWTYNSNMFLHMYLDFKLQGALKTSVDIMSSVGKQIEFEKIMNDVTRSFVYYDEEPCGKAVDIMKSTAKKIEIERMMNETKPFLHHVDKLK